MRKILVAGARGMVGGAIVRALKERGECSILTPSHQELDFIDQKAVRQYLEHHTPNLVIIAAARVGGIYANNTYPATFIYENLMIAANLIHESHIFGVQNLIFLGSSCIYPKFAEQPIGEEALLTGALEPTNEAYAIAKIAGLKLCEYYSKQYGRNYFSLMPCNLYGKGDNYHPENSHVIPALIRKFHEAKVNKSAQVCVWGTGSVKREFLYVDDLAEAVMVVLDKKLETYVLNVGSSDEVTIYELAHLIKSVVGYEGEIQFDRSKPEGTPRKKLKLTKIEEYGWQAKTHLREGLALAYEDFFSSD